MIPYGKQSIDDEDIQSVVAALKGDYLTTGPLVAEFENKIGEYVGSNALVVSSGTAALHCAYKAIGLKEGDEIITTPITFVSTQATAINLGAIPRFADVEEKTGNIDVNQITKLINSKTKAIVAVDYAGHPCAIEEIIKIARQYNLFFIEDAAHSLGSRYKGQRIGSQADLTTFSFFPTKNITTGEGGAVTSNNIDLLNKAREFSRQGLIRSSEQFKLSEDGPWHQEVHEFGLNYRLPDVLCSLGISQIKKIETFKKKRLEIWKMYERYLSGISEIQTPTFNNDVDPMWHLYPVRVPQEKRKDVFNRLRNLGIMVQVNYIPAYWHPAFQKFGYKKGLCPISEKFYSQEISLPMFTELKEQEIKYVSESLITSIRM